MIERIQDIVRKLEVYNAAYRMGSPLVSDRIYDELVEELRGLDPDLSDAARPERSRIPGFSSGDTGSENWRL